MTQTYDVIVIGSGNAGFSAASSALDHGAARVLLVEKAPPQWAGGNSAFTAGAYRTVFHGLDDVLPLVENVSVETAKQIDMAPYTEADFRGDLDRMTSGRADAELVSALVGESNETTKWLAKNGVRFQLSFNRQAYQIDGRYKFWGGMVLSVVDGGKGLIQQHTANAKRKGVEIRYDSPVVKLLTRDTSAGAGPEVVGVTVRDLVANCTYDVHARGGVVLAAGGFESSPQLRAQYLGPGWDLAYVRGTPHNTGDLLRLAIDEVGAAAAGHWSGCHSTCWDANAPRNAGDLVLTNQFTKSGYPLGVMVNVEGERFVDEGEDMRNFTYAKFGRAVLGQPEGVAWQVWDREGAGWLREEEYGEGVVEKVWGESMEELAEKMRAGGFRGAKALVEGVREYNEAVTAFRRENPDVKFDPSKKDGLSTRSSSGGLRLDKTNWATPITKGPFLAVKIACGITFTFGGLKIDPGNAAVISQASGRPIPGLYCTGEMVGGLFYGNYPGGSGLTSGAVFGRKSGRAAAQRSQQLREALLKSQL
ncbi:FAD/NAD(P)-binding domain-containing protein [Eremomyces bilateralis CBS 781.70]|uniref:FAD/NAD(P)-binding domain-containing protein n=1 Tax=Eremomyces bilateralis CBS 781.70 TaxID=1392243 RepID=A0A6G1G642_9PEZI|nr:FAD/NAD(P)-binding domain-containing protein [Eremomyces bilateralis CBS 781.70]KAF1813396.1 FAD/NAD(P)-binding domain-containing protein [Eremomyces bilateralis CBS 781.70]